MNPSITNRTGAKVRFFAIYTLSILLLFFLVSSFLLPVKKDAGRTDHTTAAGAATIEQLHERMVPLQTATIAFFDGASPEAKAEVDRQATAFQMLLDSLRENASSVSDEAEQKKLESVLQLFGQAAAKEQELVQVYAARPANSNEAASVPATNDELEELKAILVQKEERIAALEKQKPGSQPNAVNGDGTDWKEKYNKLKTASEKSATQLAAMRESYKEVVEDNRRLITQLQAARAAKN